MLNNDTPVAKIENQDIPTQVNLHDLPIDVWVILYDRLTPQVGIIRFFISLLSVNKALFLKLSLFVKQQQLIKPPEIKEVIPISNQISNSMIIIDNNNQYWACGNNHWSKLGIKGKGNHECLNLPTPMNFPFNIKKIIDAYSGLLFLDINGDVWKSGSVRWVSAPQDPTKFPVQIKTLRNIKKIVLHVTSVFFLDMNGNVWVIDKNSDISTPVQIKNLLEIKKMVGSEDHIFFLDNIGQIWSYSYKHGFTGGTSGIPVVEPEIESNSLDNFEDFEESERFPSEKPREFRKSRFMDVKQYSGIPVYPHNKYEQFDSEHYLEIINLIYELSNIKKIFTTANRTFFLDNANRAWASGLNHFGQLGIGNNEYQPFPILITSLGSIKKIFIAGTSTFFLDEFDETWACGYNKSGQLCIEHNCNVNLPTKINLLKKIKHITSGYQGSVIFLDHSGEIWTCGEVKPVYNTQMSNIKKLVNRDIFIDKKNQLWVRGSNKYGELGLGHYQFQKEFIKVSYFYDQKKNIIRRFNVNILALLVRDQQWYSQFCFEVLLEKLPQETVKIRRECFNLIEGTHWHQTAVPQLLLKNLAALGQKVNLPENELESIKQEAILAVKQLMPQVLALPEALLLIDLVKAYNNEETSPYGFIRQTKTFFGTSNYSNTDAWAEIIRFIKTNLKILRSDPDITLTWQQYQDYCIMMKTDTARIFSFDFFQPEEDFEYEGNVIYSEEEICQGLNIKNI